MTFDEWWDEWQGKASQRFTYNDRVFAEEAWDYQQARIDELEEEIRCLCKADIVRVPTKDSMQARIDALKIDKQVLVERDEKYCNTISGLTSENLELQEEIDQLKTAVETYTYTLNVVSGEKQELQARIDALTQIKKAAIALHRRIVDLERDYSADDRFIINELLAIDIMLLGGDDSILGELLEAEK